jgi:molybdenum cofactor cytidylyltransferase
MRLLKALRLGNTSCLALVGSGGKTTAMFQIGRELVGADSNLAPLSSTVLLAATTHMSVEQLNRADRHIILETADDVVRSLVVLPQGLVLLTGPQVEEGRTAGLPMPVMDRLHFLADEHHLPLLIEADGSRQKPLKAPAEHEPVVPGWVDTIVVVCGLSGIGKPLSAQWVYRPDLFAELALLSEGELITQEAIARVLTSPQGGLKDIPPGVRRVVLLNQADTAEFQAAAYRLADHLLPHYHSVVIGSLSPTRSEYSGTREAKEPLSGSPFSEADGIFAVHESVAGIILAAGGASRMGQIKQVMRWRGEPFVRRVAYTALSAGLSPVIVVTGSFENEVESAVQDLSLSVVHNVDWEAGQSTSVITGLRELPSETGAAVFLLADQPQVPVGLVQKLLEVHAASLSPIVAPQVRDQRANPVLFDRQMFSRLLSLKGDIGGRALFSQYPVTWLPWHDDSIALDIDTLDDYHRLLEI